MRMGLLIGTNILAINQTHGINNEGVIVIDVSIQRTLEHDSQRIFPVNGIMTIFVVADDL
jgi:hypothetical protein